MFFADVIDKYQIPGSPEKRSFPYGAGWDPTSREASVGRAENADFGITVATLELLRLQR